MKEFKFGEWVPLLSTRPPQNEHLLFWVVGSRGEFFSGGYFGYGESPASDTVRVDGIDLTFVRENKFKSRSLQITHWMPAPHKP